MKLLPNYILPTALNLPVLLAHLIIPVLAYGHSLHVPKGLYEVIAVRIPACTAGGLHGSMYYLHASRHG